MMRMTAGLALSLAVASMVASGANAGALAGDEPTDDQMIVLPGYGASLAMPEGWAKGDTMGMAFGRLHPASAFHDRVTTTIADPDGGRWCAFTAWSELTCRSGADPVEEIGTASFTPVALPVADALRTHTTDPRGVCHRYLLGDTADLYSLTCCGEQAEPDAFLSIARTIELPAVPRTARSGDEADFVSSIRAVAGMAAAWPPGTESSSIGSPTTGEHVAHHDGWLQRLETASGVTRDGIETVEVVFDDGTGRLLLAVEGLHVPGATPDVVLAGYLDWMSNQWGRWSRDHPDDPPRLERDRSDGRDIIRVYFDDGETEILYAESSSVAGLRGPNPRLAATWIEALECGHIDVQTLLHEALMAEFRSRQ